MKDESYLDRKYFIDDSVYNCPFCNRNNVAYELEENTGFDWSENTICYVYITRCASCGKRSMHLSYERISEQREEVFHGRYLAFKKDIDIDSKIFYSAPSSFFILDERINREIRELITEAEGCLKMNYLTGASACMRKSIYELLILEKVEAEHYEERIKLLKDKHPETDPQFFDILGHIQQMTSDKIHEQSWDKWDSKKITLIIETLKTVLYDIYIAPKVRENRSNEISKLREKALNKK